MRGITVIILGSTGGRRKVGGVVSRGPSLRVERAFGRTLGNFSIVKGRSTLRDLRGVRSMSSISPIGACRMRSSSGVGLVNKVDTENCCSESGRQLANGNIGINMVSANVSCGRPSLQEDCNNKRSLISGSGSPVRAGTTKKRNALRNARITKVVTTGNEVRKITPRTAVVTCQTLKPNNDKAARRIVTTVRRTVGSGMSILGLSLKGGIGKPSLPVDVTLGGTIRGKVATIASSNGSNPGV